MAIQQKHVMQSEAIAKFHSSLSPVEIFQISSAAKSAGIPLYVIDRSSDITANRLAKILLFKPYLVKQLVAAQSPSPLASAAASSASFAPSPDVSPLISTVLTKERAEYMAKILISDAIDGSKGLVVVPDGHISYLTELLTDEQKFNEINFQEIIRKGIPMWPMLFFLYLILPVTGGIYIWLQTVGWMNKKVLKIFGLRDSREGGESRAWTHPSQPDVIIADK
jgi:pheromone shutdown protein TraB